MQSFLYILFFLALEGISNGILQAHVRFYPPAIAQIAYNVILLVPMFLAKQNLTIDLMVYILIGAFFARMMTSVICIRKTSFRLLISKGQRDRQIVKLFKFAPPIFLSTVMLEINFVVDKAYATQLGSGTVSVINYSEKIITLITSTVFSTIGFVFLPHISKLYAENREKFLITCNKTVQFIMPVAIICTGICYFQAKNLITFFFAGGAFDISSINRTTLALQGFSIGLFAMIQRDIMKKVHFAMHNTRVPMIGSILNCVTNIILVVLFAPRFGEIAITIATSVAAVVEMLLLLYIDARTEKIIRCARLTKEALIYGMAMIVAGFICSHISIPIAASDRIAALVNLLVFCISYTILFTVLCSPMLIV